MSGRRVRVGRVRVARLRVARPARAARAAASVVVALALLLYALPRLTGARWSEISAALSRLTVGQIALLSLVWVLGLAGYTWVLTGGLPGLTHAQALTLNLSTSSVSNLVPFGGALGVAVGYAMARSWGFGAAAYALMTLVTGIWNVLAKLALPVLAMVALLLSGQVGDRRLAFGAGAAAVLLGLVVLALVGALSSERVAAVVGRLADRGAVGVSAVRGRFGRRREAGGPVPPPGGGPVPPPGGGPVPPPGGGPVPPPGGGRWRGEVLALRHRTVGLVRERWPRLTFGLAVFLGAQAVLQWLCLRMLGSDLGPAQVFAGFAFGRLLTALVLTPGGVGFSETGAAALLVNGFGGDPAVTASGVLLFSGYAYFLEIWAGGVGYGMWSLRRSWRRPVVTSVHGGEPDAVLGDGGGSAEGRMEP